jgi:hypothetical protein
MGCLALGPHAIKRSLPPPVGISTAAFSMGSPASWGTSDPFATMLATILLPTSSSKRLTAALLPIGNQRPYVSTVNVIEACPSCRWTYTGLSPCWRSRLAKLCRSECGVKCGGSLARLSTPANARAICRLPKAWPSAVAKTHAGASVSPRLSRSVFPSISRRSRVRARCSLISTVRPCPLLGVLRLSSENARSMRSARPATSTSVHWRPRTSPVRSPVRARQRKTG